MAQGAVLVSMARETRSGPVGGSNAVFTEYRVNVFSCLFGVLCRPRHSLSDKTVRLVVIMHQLRGGVPTS